MDALKRNLTEYGIDFDEKVFTTDGSIDSLLPKPFVSTRVNDYVILMGYAPDAFQMTFSVEYYHATAIRHSTQKT